MKLVLNKQTEQEINNYMASSHGPVIFYGSHGMGQEEIARQTAGDLLNLPEYGLSADKHPDYYEVHPENGMIRTGQMENLREWCAFETERAAKKVILIYKAEQMNLHAQNAMLKLLEEGTDSHTILILSERPLPETVNSRCQIVNFRKISPEQMKQLLAEIKPQMDSQKQKMLEIMADGKCGLLQDLLEKESFLAWMSAYFKTLQTFQERRELLEVLHAVQEKDREYACNILKEGENLRLFLEFNLCLFGNALYTGLGILKPDICSGHLAKQYKTEELLNILKSFVCGFSRLTQRRFTGNDFFRILQTLTGGR